MKNVFWCSRLQRRLLALTTGVLAVAVTIWAIRSPAQGQTGKEKPEVDPVVVDSLAPGVPGQQQVDYINEELERLWRDNEVTPSERCTDYEYIRRASLDIIGRIAKVDEISKFMADPPKFRRSLLIERLLKSEDYANNFSSIWSTLLMTRSMPKLYREQMFLYLFDEFLEEDHDWSKTVTDIVTATGRTNENGAVNFILAHLGEEFKGGRRGQNNKQIWEEKGRYEMVPVTSRTTKLFLGLQTQCTQCHDHPFWPDVWQQKHFWGVNAFFRQVDAPQGGLQAANQRNMAMGQKDLKENPDYNKDAIVPYERRNGTLFYTRARFLNGTKYDTGAKSSRREVLAKFITTSPYFAKAFVNRTWGHFMGVSFTKNNAADFGAHNPIITPKLREGESKDWLLGRLANDWATNYKHNPKHLIRWICNSKAYHLSSVANKSNGSREAEGMFARMLLKAMNPEQLFESLMIATQYQQAQNTDDRKKLREKWLNQLVVNFGDDEGNEQTFNGTVVQALLLMNGEDINKALNDKKNGTVANILKKSGMTPRKAMEALYMAALNRPPTDEEYKIVLSPAVYQLPRVRPPSTVGEQKSFNTAFYQDMFWAILNSNEFFLNH